MTSLSDDASRTNLLLNGMIGRDLASRSAGQRRSGCRRNAGRFYLLAHAGRFRRLERQHRRFTSTPVATASAFRQVPGMGPVIDVRIRFSRDPVASPPTPPRATSNAPSPRGEVKGTGNLGTCLPAEHANLSAGEGFRRRKWRPSGRTAHLRPICADTKMRAQHGRAAPSLPLDNNRPAQGPPRQNPVRQKTWDGNFPAPRAQGRLRELAGGARYRVRSPKAPPPALRSGAQEKASGPNPPAHVPAPQRLEQLRQGLVERPLLSLLRRVDQLRDRECQKTQITSRHIKRPRRRATLPPALTSSRPAALRSRLAQLSGIVRPLFRQGIFRPFYAAPFGD